MDMPVHRMMEYHSATTKEACLVQLSLGCMWVNLKDTTLSERRCHGTQSP